MTVHTSLAVKYRPTKWEDVAGHATAVSRLKGMVKTGKVPQAIMFTGPSGTGKTTLARMLARYLNCDKKTACGKCSNCQLGDKHPDIKEVNAAEARGIDEVRRIISEAKYKPQFGKYRFVIVDEFQQATPQAAQALLKPLEEPPANTIYIICTMEPDKVHQAIVGRCNLIELSRLGKDEITKRLVDIAKAEKASFISEKTAAKIAESSGGQVRNAVTSLESVIQFVEGQEGSPEKMSEEKLDKVITKALSSLLELTDDMVAIKVLLSIYNGSVKSLHTAILDANDFNSLINKMAYLNLYLLDARFASDHKGVWHTANNRKFMSIVKEKVKIYDKPGFENLLLLVLDKINEVKTTMGTFLANDRAIFTAKLGLIAVQVKTKYQDK